MKLGAWGLRLVRIDHSVHRHPLLERILSLGFQGWHVALRMVSSCSEDETDYVRPTVSITDEATTNSVRSTAGGWMVLWGGGPTGQERIQGFWWMSRGGAQKSA